jgi:hypothetical protein
MKIYENHDEILDAAHSVIERGVAVIEGTKTIVISYADNVIEYLKEHPEISPAIGYMNVPFNGYLYYIFDLEKYISSDPKLKSIILEIDKINKP